MADLTGIDFSRDGKQFGHLEIPSSTHRSAYGMIMVPVIYLRNGPGPRAMISAGVHGDEYEGQIAVRNLALDLSQHDISGSLILLPMANAPAVNAAARVSPLDGGNLNRLFPGKVFGSPTESIAFAIEHLLLAGCDFAYDIHSGGASLLYDAIAITTETGDARKDKARLDLLRGLGLPSGMILPAVSQMGMEASLDGAMLRHDVIGVSAEFGGGGRLSPRFLDRCQNSIERFLVQSGIRVGDHKNSDDIRCSIYNIDRSFSHVYARFDGLFETKLSPGYRVSEGDVLGTVHHLDQFGAAPVPVVAEGSGTVLCIRSMPQVRNGDCLFQIGVPRPFCGA